MTGTEASVSIDNSLCGGNLYITLSDFVGESWAS